MDLVKHNFRYIFMKKIRLNYKLNAMLFKYFNVMIECNNLILASLIYFKFALYK